MAKKKNESLLTPWLWLIVGSIISLVFVIVLAAATQNSYQNSRVLGDSVNIGGTFEDCVNLQVDYEVCVKIYEEVLLGNE